METTDLRALQSDFEKTRASTPEAQELYKNAEGLILEFQREFDKNRIISMTLDEYVVGKKSIDSFCYWVAVKTKYVGNIAVSGAGRSFGVYYNKKNNAYMITERAKSRKATEKEAEKYLEKIKIGLNELLDEAEKKDFEKIITTSKELPLNQQAIGKILALYFPDKYLSVFSEGHVNIFLDNLDLLNKKTRQLNIVERKELLLDFKRNDAVFKKWSNRKYVDFLYRKMFDANNGYSARELDSTKSYFVLRTGGGEYSDQPESKYNFKQGIPGYKQLLDAGGNAEFVYIEKGLFYGKGKIGDIINYDKEGTIHYDARVLGYQKIEPAVHYAEVSGKISKPFTQAGIMKISKEDYEAIVFPTKGVSNRLSAELDLSIDELSFDDLLFEDEEELKSSIYAALMSGKHIMFIGPPGTGKTEIAREIGEIVAKKNYIDAYVLTTATSDWTTFDTIGGYVPTKDGESLEFMPGQFLRCFKASALQCNRWLIIDEINRADIDKAFGQLFTVLSGQNVELPFVAEDRNIRIISQKKWNKEKAIESNEFVLPNSWRLIATLNTYDKASLYQMSYAFMRRFAFINIGTPSDSFIDDKWDAYLQKWKITLSADLAVVAEKIKEFWKSMNQSCRHLGPAIIKDMLEFLSKYKKPQNSDVSDVMTILISTFVLPQFEGLEDKELEELKGRLGVFWNFGKIECLFNEMFK